MSVESKITDNSFVIGECMLVCVYGDYAEIHIEDLVPMTRDESLIAYTRSLFSSVCFSLSILARYCEQDDERFRGVTHFYGYSHLVRKKRAESLGFVVCDTPQMQYTEPTARKRAKRRGYQLVKAIAHNNREWAKVKKNYKEPQFAYITRESLIAHHGSESENPFTDSY